MKITDLDAYVEHFRFRVVQDALNEATCAYWQHRADRFAAAMPREGDFTGQSTAEDIDAQRKRLSEVEFACRVRAQVAIGGHL